MSDALNKSMAGVPGNGENNEHRWSDEKGVYVLLVGLSLGRVSRYVPRVPSLAGPIRPARQRLEMRQAKYWRCVSIDPSWRPYVLTSGKPYAPTFVVGDIYERITRDEDRVQNKTVFFPELFHPHFVPLEDFK